MNTAATSGAGDPRSCLWRVAASLSLALMAAEERHVRGDVGASGEIAALRALCARLLAWSPWTIGPLGVLR